MGVQVLSPESTHAKHLRSLPKLPKNSHYSMKPLNSVKPTRALPTVPNSNVSKLDPSVKLARALPRVPKQMDNKKAISVTGRHGRALPEVPFREVGNLKNSDTSISSRASTPQRTHNTSFSSHNESTHPMKNHLHHHSNTHHSNTHHAHHKNHHASHNDTHNTHVTNTHGNTTQRTLPKLPKLLQKPKPEQNRIEYMHDVYRKEGDTFSDEGNYEQALKSYNLALKFISNDKTTMIARSRGLLQKAELLLEQGDYETALNYFQKGARMRPDKDDFHDGIEKAKHGLSENHKVARKRKNTISPEEIVNQKKSKDRTEKARKNRENAQTHAQSQRTLSHLSDDNQDVSMASNGSSHRESVSIIQEEAPKAAPQPPMHVPAPPSQPPPSMSRGKLGRQMTPMPGRLRTRQSEQRTMEALQHPSHPEIPGHPATEDDVNEDVMKHILGNMYKDRDYLEKLLGETENITLPGTTNLGSTAKNGLNFLYDKVLTWVRKGEQVPVTQPTTLPRETKTSARRKSMAHGSSVESLLEEQEKENEARLKKRSRRKGQSKAPHTWYNFLENRKLEEAQERKNARNKFLHVVEGHKISPKEQANLEMKTSKRGSGGSRGRKEGGMRKSRDHDSKESLNQGFLFKSRKNTPMETSDSEEAIARRKTPPTKLRRFGGIKERQERRQAAVAKYAAKELEEIELAYAEGKQDECASKARHLMKILDGEDFPEKESYIATLHSYLGNVAIGRRDYEKGLGHHNMDLEIGEKYKLDEAVSRALGNLGRVYVLQKRHQEALDVFLRKTPMCTSRIETAWLFHEIGNCFLALGDFEYAKDAAKKSLESAEEAVEWSYQLQSCVLMGVAEVKLKQYHAAFNTFEKALDQARLQGDEKAEEALREALQDVNDRIVEEMRTKGPLNFPPDSRSDNFMTPMSRASTTVTDYQLQGLSRSRAEIAKMQADLGPRFRADYARTPAGYSEYSSILIPDDDGEASLTDSPRDHRELNIDLDRLRTESTMFGSALDLRDNIRSETFVSGKGKV
ncbi:TTC25-like protein [Mya arenaria]|uniref:Outer dynein arm-docking complex subunit 4 n=1 Tax=Mya arenaria TaxID=6604 RepID=A0ABY7E976_MYAAR|nr:TTC25-like protein [Mya arenaria]